MTIATRMYYLRCLFIISAIFAFVIRGQSQTIVHVEKLKCEKESGYSIELHVFYNSWKYDFSKEGRFKTYYTKRNGVNGSYTVHRDFNTLPDSIKLEIVRQLLTFENDTSLCCYLVQELPYDGNDGRCGCPIGREYRIQIDALFIINAICFDMSRSYSCVPMIMDTVTGKCVNEDAVAIKEEYHKYRVWYNECLKAGKIDKHFPFNEGRYVWKNGKQGL